MQANRLNTGFIGVMCVLGLAHAGCDDSTPPITTVVPPPDAGCVVDLTPRRYEVYLVVDVSGSMAPFVQSLSRQIDAFARSFPERDAQDVRVLVNFYVIAFVNDIRWFPDESRRMTSPIAVQSALANAVVAGANNQLLNRAITNAEPEENLLDALAEVIASNPDPDAALLVLVATDANFVEAPEELSGNIQVQASYDQIRMGLDELDARIHAFTPDQLDGLTRNWRGQPPLTSLAGSGQYRLQELSDSEELIQQTLQDIARGAACN